jgi:hypothetical protein
MITRALITGIAALFLATGAAHAQTVETEGMLLGEWNCPGIEKVEFRKYMVHELGFTIKGNHYRTVVPRGAYRGSFVRCFNCTVASIASMRSPPAAMA